MKPEPTKRAVIDPLRRCPLRCLMCYYLHKDLSSARTWREVREDVDAAICRGNICADVTGGEPMVWGDIVRLVGYCTERQFALRVITSCIAPEQTFKRVIDAGVDSFLVSMHGLVETHNRIVGGYRQAREIQEKRLQLFREHKIPFDVNFVITSLNQEEIESFAWYLRSWHPRVVNFINFNPHHEWRNHPETKNLVADLRVVEDHLAAAIEVLENSDFDTGVNVRYYPMCRIPEQFRRCICNDLHVVFDSGEWDYEIQPKELESFEDWAVKTSLANEEKGQPCCDCDLQWVCGGANRFWHTAASEVYGEPLAPQKDVGLTYLDVPSYWRYRQDNEYGMIPYRANR